jgi:hypothetical protein
MRASVQAAAACSGLLMAVAAAADGPRAWTWDAPVGTAASDPAFAPLVRVSVFPTSSPQAIADEVASRVTALGVPSGRVGIVLNNWGRETLVGNPLERVAGGSLPPPVDRGSPWTAVGRAQAGAWMDAFIARYRALEQSTGVPAPSRWHMDSELRLPALCYLPDVSACWSDLPLDLFAAMQADPRWKTEPLLMSPGGVPTQRTVAQHWAANGSPGFDPSLPRDHPANRAWSRWWDGMTREAVDGAFHEAFFARIRQAWPQARSSEFAQSLRLDGGLEPDGSRREFVDFEWWDRGWMRSRWDGRGDLQATTLYLFGTTFLAPGVGFWRENMRLHRANLDACLHSYGGVPASEVTPWVSLPRIPLPAGPGLPDRPIGDDEFLEMMVLLRGRGIDEFMLWPGGNESLWLAAQRGIHAAWECDLASVAVEVGSASGDAAGLARRADRQPLAVTGGQAGQRVRATFRTPALAPGSGPGTFWIAVEATAAGAPVGATVRALTSSGAWADVTDIMIGATGPGAHWIGPTDAAGLVRADGSMELAITVAQPATVRYDLLQVARVPGAQACPADLNVDGFVDGGDLGILLNAWGACVGACGADFNLDGVVDGSDLGVLLAGWGRCSA